MSIKGYKAFNRGMICKGKQYEENTTYEENGNKICEAGVMHFCENPFDVLDYYPLIDEDGNISDFADVEAIGDIYKGKDKTATNKLHIGAKLGFKGFIKACVDFTIEKTKVETVKADDVGISSGYYAKIGSSGDYARIGSSGDCAQIGSSGYSAKIGSSGDSAQIGSSGYRAQIGSSGDSAKIGSSGDSAKIGSSGDSAQIGSSGDYAQIGSSGYYAKIGSSGDYAKIGSSGDYAQIGSSGDSAKITSEGNNSVVMAAGCNSIAKAKIGSWITLAEWIRTDKANDSGNYIWIPKCVKTEYVDGERIKEDIFYKLVDGEFKEVESED
nr:MAG TPA: hypothetical protein [Caudoviricetes sp.]